MNFTRGDTFYFCFQRIDVNGNVIPIQADEVWFTVKKNANTEDKEIQKTLSAGTIKYDSETSTYHVVINADETQNFTYNRGYFFDIQVYQEPYIKTIATGTLKVSKEATFEFITSDSDDQLKISSENKELVVDVNQESIEYIVISNGELDKYIGNFNDQINKIKNDLDINYPRNDDLSAVATSGLYNDLIDKPTIPEATVVVDNLTSASATDALSANQGRILDEKITDISDSIDDEINAIKADVESNTADIDEINVRIDELEDNLFDVGEASGSELYITDSINRNFLALSIDGKSEQETNSGKNKFVPTLTYEGATINQARCTASVNDDEFVLEATGADAYIGVALNSGLVFTNTNGYLYEVEPNKTYTFSCTNQAFTSLYVNQFGEDKRTNSNFIGSSGNSYLTFTTEATTKYVSFRFGIPTSVSGQTYSTKVQFEEGDTATENERYNGGHISPSPEAPSEKKSVRGIINYLNLNDIEETTVNGVTYSCKNGELKLNGTATGAILIDFEMTDIKAGTYYFDSTITNATGSYARYIRNEAGDNNLTNSGPITYSTNDKVYFRFYANSGCIFDNSIVKAKLNDSDGKDYSLYGSWLKIVSNSKNLVSNSLWRAGGDYSNLTVGRNATKVDVKYGETYSLSAWYNENLIENTTNGYAYAYDYASDGTRVGTGDYMATVSGPQQKTISDANISYLMIYLCVKCSAGDVYKVQFETGSATEYDPYKESAVLIDMNTYDDDGEINGNHELCSIREVKDDLYVQFNESDKQYHVYLKKNIESVILDGSEDWQGGADASTSGYKYFYCTKFTDVPVSYDIICDKLNPYIDGALESGTVVATSTIGLNLSESNNLRVIFDSSLLEDISTGTNALNSFKNWLSQNKPEVLYILANPYTIDLGPVNMLKAYKNITNVSTNDDLEPTINASYYKDFKVSISDLAEKVKTLLEVNDNE